jgi:hypothetical protein
MNPQRSTGFCEAGEADDAVVVRYAPKARSRRFSRPARMITIVVSCAVDSSSRYMASFGVIAARS